MAAKQRATWTLSAVAALAGLTACSPRGDTAGSTSGGAPEGTVVVMNYAAGAGFFDAPFPGDARLSATGGVEVADFPNPYGMDLIKRILALVTRDARGFATTSGVFFQLSAPLGGDDLPTLKASIEDGSPVVLLGADPASPDYLKRYPVTSSFDADGGPYGAPNQLSLIPLQGIPLLPKARYAAVVRRALHDAGGGPLGQSPAMKQIAAGERPDGMSDAAFTSTKAGLEAANKAGIPSADIAAITVFTTDDPVAGLRKVTAAMIAKGPPKPEKAFVRTEAPYPDFCVYASTIRMPEYQQGSAPYTYTESGGDWLFDAAGEPIFQRDDEAGFVVTVPRTPMPAAGYPLIVFSKTGGGGERPLVDRGPQAKTGGPPIEPGTGPALYFAKAGFAGTSIDGPQEGLRNTTKDNEDFLMFNVGNPAALRDNVRQSSAEMALTAHIMETVAFDVSDCPGAGGADHFARFDMKTVGIMGHSMGASITPPALAVEPRFRVVLLSGAGGSFIENVMFKLQPLAVLPLAQVLLGISSTGYSLTEHDPALSMFQWAAEPADSPPYGDLVLRHRPASAGPAPHILMMQGIVDHYIMPTIADATSLSLGLDIAGPELDGKAPEIARFTPIGELLGYVGRGAVAYPASGNMTVGGAKITAVLTQHPSDGIEDGHEVVFQTEPPKHEYRCFLAAIAAGKLPAVPADGKALDPCP